MDSYSENQGKELNASGKRELTDEMIEKLLSVYESSVKNQRFFTFYLSSIASAACDMHGD